MCASNETKKFLQQVWNTCWAHTYTWDIRDFLWLSVSHKKALNFKASTKGVKNYTKKNEKMRINALIKNWLVQCFKLIFFLYKLFKSRWWATDFIIKLYVKSQESHKLVSCLHAMFDLQEGKIKCCYLMLLREQHWKLTALCNKWKNHSLIFKRFIDTHIWSH